MKFTLRFVDPIKWPNKCVCCGGIATTRYTANCRLITGYAFKFFWHEVEHQKMGLPYPVCQKHEYWAITVRTIYFLSFFFVLFGGIFILSELMRDGMPISFGVWGFLIGYLFIVLIFIESIRLHPVRLKEFGEHLYTFVIRNEDYAKEFAFINDFGAKESRLSQWRPSEPDPIFSLKRVAMGVGGVVLVFILVIAVLVIIFAIWEYWRSSP